MRYNWKYFMKARLRRTSNFTPHIISTFCLFSTKAGTMYSLILRNARLSDHEGLVDIVIDQGTIAQIQPTVEAAASQELDCQGQLVTPPFVESHIHLDSVLTAGQPRFNGSGTLFEGIQLWGERKPSLT
jgi:cytosine deaminase